MTGERMQVAALDLPGGRAGPDLRAIASLAPGHVRFDLVSPKELADQPRLERLLDPVPDRLLVVGACWLASLALSVVPPPGTATTLLLVEPETPDDEDIRDELLAIYATVGLHPAGVSIEACRSLEAFDRWSGVFRGALTAAATRRLGPGCDDLALGLATRYSDWVRALLIARDAAARPPVVDGGQIVVVSRAGVDLPEWLPGRARTVLVEPVSDAPVLSAPTVLAAVRALHEELFGAAGTAPGVGVAAADDRP